MRTHPQRRRSPWISLALAPLLLGACLGDDDTTDPATTTDATGEDEPDDRDGSSADTGDDPSDDEPDAADDADTTEPEDDAAPVGRTDLPDPIFTAGPCPFEVEIELTVDCGTVTVPASRTRDTADTIDLAVAIIRTPNPNAEPDPVVFLAGGPGGVALAGHGSWWFDGMDPEDHPFLDDRDFVLLDQRGVGASTPSLWCAEDTAEPESLEECHDRLVASDIVLADYSTPENAADVADVRRALGIDQWNLYGSSYGTRLALAVLRDHPDGVRSVMLEGVYPPDVVPAYEEFIPTTMASIAVLDGWCQDQDGCNEAYGDVLELLEAAMETADAIGTDSPMTSQNVFDLAHSALYSHMSAVELPFALWVAASGDVDLAYELLSGTETVEGLQRPNPTHEVRRQVESATDEDSSGTFHSIECREEHAFTDVAAVEAQGEALLAAGVGPLLVDAVLTAALGPVDEPCRFWDSDVAEAWEREPVISEVPTLLLSGVLDPITPPAWGDVAAAGLAQAVVVVAPTLSHSITLEDWCIDDIVREFLADPSTTPDTACVATMERFPITLPD